MLTGIDVVLCFTLWFGARGLADVQTAAAVAALNRSPSVPDPEVDAILTAWENATANVSRVSCRLHRFRYDHTFAVEFRSIGSLSVDRFGNVDYNLESATVPRNRPAVLVPLNKQSYSLKPDRAERIEYSREVVTITAPESPVQRILVADLEPVLARGWSLWSPFLESLRSAAPYALPPEGADIPADLMELPQWRAQLPIARPFILGLPRAEVLAKFRVRNLSRSSDEVRLEFIPRTAPMSDWYCSAKLILNPREFTPIAILTTEADGMTETVHVLSVVRYERKMSD